jgi:hypothetical protein
MMQCGATRRVRSQGGLEVAVLTPALFASRGHAGIVPRLTVNWSIFLPPELQDSLTDWRFDPRLDPYLQPFAFESGANQRTSGVPLMMEHHVHELVGELEQSQPESPLIGRWWDLVRTETGEYALFPGDDGPNLRVVVTTLVPTGSAIELRRLDTQLAITGTANGPALMLEQGGDGESPELPEPCAHEVRGIDEGAPYTGRCANKGCSEACSPRVFLTPNDGIYRLLGCNC